MTKQESTALVASVVNAVLTATKFILASATGSIALLAEAYHSLSDIVASGLVYCALRADRRRAERQEAGSAEVSAENNKIRVFWDGRWDAKAAIAIGLVLTVVAANIFIKVFRSEPMPLNRPILAACVMAFLILCSDLLHRLETSVGKQCNSMALLADGRHARSDMLVSTLVLLILVGDRIGLRLDRPAAGIISVLILIDAIRTLRSGARNYIAIRRGEVVEGKPPIEDTVAQFVERTIPKIVHRFWAVVTSCPGLGGTQNEARQRLGLLLPLFAVLAASVIYIGSGFYIVPIGNQAMVERFGKPMDPDRPVGPGLHYHFPSPIEKVIVADTSRLRRMVLGYISSEKNSLGFILWTNRHYLEEMHFLTGENSVVDIAGNVHYRVTNLFDYLYSARDPDTILEQAGHRALREILGQEEFFGAITGRRDVLELELQRRMQAESDARGLGLKMVAVRFRDMHPPAEVAPDFEDVVSAQEDYERFIEEGRGYQAYHIPTTRGEAYRMVSRASAERNEKIYMSEGESASFIAQQEVYQRYASITRRRLLLETFEQALPPIKKYVVQSKDVDSKPTFFFGVSRVDKNGVPAPVEVPEWLIEPSEE
ncbi:MAG: FtsH protease activity modulator HflK [bacterium]